MKPSMNFLGALVLAFGVSTTVAKEAPQGTGTPSPPTASYNKGPDTGKQAHVVTVAKTAHRFDPEILNATIGDVITFEFYPVTHSATLADYRAPCVPWSAYHIGDKDIWSGLITEEKPRANPQTWSWRVDTNDPRFFYCSSPGSCAGWGMVFAVNPSTDQTFDVFQAKAKQADYEMSPGQVAPKESTSTTKTSTTSHKGMSTGTIVGIVIGAIAAVGIVGLLFFLIGRSRRKSASEKAAAAAAAAPLAQPGVDAGPVLGAYGDHPPPGYYGQGPQAGWDGKGLAPPAPPLSPSPSHYNPHASMYGSPSPTNPHASWAPSELGGESTTQPQRVEIYTPGVDDRIPLNNPPKSP